MDQNKYSLNVCTIQEKLLQYLQRPRVFLQCNSESHTLSPPFSSPTHMVSLNFFPLEEKERLTRSWGRYSISPIHHPWAILPWRIWAWVCSFIRLHGTTYLSQFRICFTKSTNQYIPRRREGERNACRIWTWAASSCLLEPQTNYVLVFTFLRVPVHVCYLICNETNYDKCHSQSILCLHVVLSSSSFFSSIFSFFNNRLFWGSSLYALGNNPLSSRETLCRCNLIYLMLSLKGKQYTIHHDFFRCPWSKPQGWT